MTTTKELIEFLKKFPDDTVVKIIKAKDEGSCYERYTSVGFENLDLTNDEHFEFTDWTGFKGIEKDHYLYNLKTLEFGLDES